MSLMIHCIDNINDRIIFKDEVYQIAGAAMEVYNHLNSGFLENVYLDAMAIELHLRNIPFAVQIPVKIRYKNFTLDRHYTPDLVCYDKIIVELKAIKQISAVEEAQMINYLKASGFEMGVLLNFGFPQKLEWKRFIYTQKSV